MTEAGDDVDEAERIAAGADREKEAWTATLADMGDRADARREAGWEVVEIAAGHTAPEAPETGSDRFGLTYVVPGEEADRFRDVFEPGRFPQYQVFRAEADGTVFLLTELLDPESSTAVLLAGTYDLRHALGCFRAAREAGEMYTHLQKLDGTHLGSFRHEDWAAFFPDEAVVEGYAARPDEGAGGSVDGDGKGDGDDRAPDRD